MRITLLLSFLFCAAIAFASKPIPPDSLTVAKLLYNTSWKPTAMYKPSGLFHRLRKIPLPNSVIWITIYPNELHTFTTTGVDQVCDLHHRNQNELWLDCKEPNQLIYRVVRIVHDELVLDVLSKRPGTTEYIRTSRNYYSRKRD